MVTAPPVQRPRTFLHTRGSWSARDDRIPSAVWLGIFLAGTVAGFGVDIPGFMRLKPPAPTIVDIHAFIFTAWLFILSAQVLFVLGDRIAWHKRMGLLAAFWVGLMAILGPWAALSFQAADLHTSFGDPGFLSVQLGGIIAFVALIAWGFALRRNPAAHRRMMMLATASIAGPGFARLNGHLLHLSHLLCLPPHSVLSAFVSLFYGDMLLVILMTAWDCWRGRLMRSFVIGAAALVAVEVLMSASLYWNPWNEFALSLVRAWAKL